MSKTLKTGILLTIIALVVLLLGINVNAEEFTEEGIGTIIKSMEELKELFVGQNVTYNGTTVTLNADVTINDSVNLSIDGKYTINLNGHTLKFGELYIHKGELTIDDATKTGKIDSMYLKILKDATVIVNQCNFETDTVWIEEGSEPFEALMDLTNYGNLIFKNGSIEHTLWNCEGGVVFIENGTIPNISQWGTATIKNGNFETFNTNLAVAKTELLGGKFTGWELDGFAIMLQSYEEVDEHTINTLIPAGYAAKFENFNKEPNVDENMTPMTIGYYGLSVEIVKAETLYSDIFKKIAPNGVWDFGGLVPKDLDYDLTNEMFTNLVKEVFEPYGYDAHASVLGDKEKFNPEKVKIYVYKNEGFKEEHLVSVKYLPEDSEKINIVKPVLNNMRQYKGYDEPSVEDAYVLEDLYLINYLFANAGEEYLRGDQALNFSKELIDATGGANISFKYIPKMGDGTQNRLYSYSSGEVIVYYEGKPLTTMIAASLGKYVLYIPDTVNITDDDAVIAAATKRIKDYIGKDAEFTIKEAGTLASIAEYNPYTPYDKTKTGDNYYHLIIGEKIYNFVICKKEASKLEQPKYIGNNLASNIVITSDSTEVPLDTSVTVNTYLTEAENKKIEKALGTDVYAAYDISLYSNAKKENIKKLENGNFTVSIPVPEHLKDIENLMVYYIDDEGNKTDLEVKTSDDGIVTFETNHFSTYVLAEKSAENKENEGTEGDEGSKEEETYKVTFKANGGKFSNGKETLVYEAWKPSDYEKLEKPTREGYKFIAYYIENGGLFEAYYKEAGVDKDMVVVAKWEKVKETTADNNKNPQTGDNIMLFITISGITLIGIIATIKKYKNK